MPTRHELKELAALRLREAETLFQAGLYDGAAYVCAGQMTVETHGRASLRWGDDFQIRGRASLRDIWYYLLTLRSS